MVHFPHGGGVNSGPDMTLAAATPGDEGFARTPRAANGGFILPLTLWMIAIMGLVAASLSVWVANSVANSQALAQDTDLALAQSDIRNELVYLLGARPTSFRGLE